MLCKHKLDGVQYALKMICVKEKYPSDLILREVRALARLHHHHVVRYYQAWFESEAAWVESEAEWVESEDAEDIMWGPESEKCSSSRLTRRGSSSSLTGRNRSCKGSSLSDFGEPENMSSPACLYIQMEYCPRTLYQLLQSYEFDEGLAWYLFRQIVEGLAYIHGQGIIHCDLTPKNIFFDVHDAIKIGDFGLAKFLKREDLDHDTTFASDASGSAGPIGTHFYTAPELVPKEQRCTDIDEKVDMYSLGMILFELWHPFETRMERHYVLEDLKKGRGPPADWAVKFPEQDSLLKQLLSSKPANRPSALELLRYVIPPFVKNEQLNGGSILGVRFLDPLVSGMILKAGLESGYQSILELVDAALMPQQLEPYKNTILGVEGVKGYNHLRGRRAGSSLYLDVDVEVDPFSSVSAAHDVGETVRAQLQQSHPEVSEVFIHIKPATSHISGSVNPQRNNKSSDHQNNTVLLEQMDVEDAVFKILSSNFSKKMEVQRITRHSLQGQIFLEIEVSMPPDTLIREAVEVAEEAEKKILEVVPHIIIHVSLQLRLGRPTSEFRQLSCSSENESGC